MDGTGGTNKYGYQLNKLAVKDENGNGVTVAYMVASRDTKEEVRLFIRSVKCKVQTDHSLAQLKPFDFSKFMIDKCMTEIMSVLEEGYDYQLCFFHFCQDWERFLKSAQSGVRDKHERHRILLQAQDVKHAKTPEAFKSLSSTFRKRNQRYPEVVK